ncbi:MAG: replicative DNA helicase [Gammaproteobacteria bacterium]
MKNFYSNEIYAEHAVIGSLLTDNSSLNEIGDYLHANDFSSILHREAYRAIQDLMINAKNADLICVSEYLLNEKIVREDPFIQLCEVMKSAFTPLNIKYYAEIVKQKSLDRKMIVAAQNIITSVKEQKENRLDHAQQSIAELSHELPSHIELATDILKSVVIAIDERSSSHTDITGMSTGYTTLDKITNGLHGGDLIILAGRPGMGKTLLGMNIAEHVALVKRKSVSVFSLEMSKEKLLERSLASVGNIEADQIKTGKLTEQNFKKLSSAITQYHGSRLFIDDRSFLRVADIRATCRRLKHEHDLSLIVVDYIGLMASEGENETLRVTNISRGLKLLARDFNVPVIAISQLNRAVEQRNNKRPCMADLRQSGAIEQDADLILFIYRHDVYDSNVMNKGIAEIIIAKHRNGDVGTINLSFNSRNCRFDNYTGSPVSKNQSDKSWSGQSLIY